MAGAGGILYAFSNTPLPEDHFDELAQTTFLCTAEVKADCNDKNAAAQFASAAEDREIITYEALPQNLIDAVVATEDQSFFDHQGVDPKGIARATYRFLRKDPILQGGSTITQQYVKLAFSDEDETLIRKGREAIRAIKLEQELTDECSAREDLGELTPTECAKQEILTRYLNRAYFGRGASGVQAAARTYFAKDVGDLEVAESAFLAGLLRNPNGADPEDDPDEANRRRTASLQNMYDAGYLTIDEASAANLEEWRVAPRRDRVGLGEVSGAEWGSEYFVEEVQLQLMELFPDGVFRTGGLRVYTTLDLGLQRAAYESAHAPKLENLEERDLPEMGPLFLDPNNPEDPNAALVSIDAEGRVVAMLGGTNFEERKFNLATSSGKKGRQPGSTFKPFGLALAIEQGISARSFYPAVPGVTRIGAPCSDASGPWQVTGGSSARNRYRDLIEATQWSSNIVYAQLVVDIGPNQLRDLAVSLGITTLPKPGEPVRCATILGGAEGVPVIEMATAYSVFERDGVQLDAVLIDRIEDVDGNVICRHPTKTESGYECSTEPVRTGEQVIEVSTARQVNYALSQVTAGGTGRRAPFSEDRAVVGKTGTTQNNRDGWFAGFTCDLTTVVWIGHSEEETHMVDFRKPPPEDGSPRPVDDDGNPIDDRGWPNIEGGNFPTMIWSDYMAKATAGRPPCESLETENEFPGSRLNQDLSTTTLPPCGVELDQYGYPRGKDPDSFVLITTTTAAPPPPTGQDGQPQGLPFQDDNGDQPADTTAPCIAIDQWIYQANPDAPQPTTSDGGDPNAPPAEGESTTQPSETQPPETQPPTTQPPETQPPETQPPTTASG